jgi:hypothetical protein
MTLRRTLGLLIASAALFVGLGAGVAYADGSAGTAVRADGTRVTATPQAVTPLDAGNNGSWVSGVGQCDINQNRDCWAWVNTSNGTACPSGHFCIYQNVYAAEGGKVFAFYHCTNGGSEWALHGWNGTGYYHNSNTGGAHGYLKGSSHNVLPRGDIGPGGAGSYDYRPVWFVRAC